MRGPVAPAAAGCRKGSDNGFKGAVGAPYKAGNTFTAQPLALPWAGGWRAPFGTQKSRTVVSNNRPVRRGDRKLGSPVPAPDSGSGT
jgi:hypothetical protein